MGNIYKICDADLWDSAEKIGRFTGAEIDLKDGFIHFSTADQLAETLRLHFSGRDGLRLITVDASLLDIQWEPARSGDLFPHLYTDLPLSAVRSVDPLPLGSDGLHQLPSQL
ncbi:DUF952 domain-containing protein [Alphaproteobacteria bacterium]|jgi:uncharacterized protein (DUF952 family)|nr:DUF952 domain-containing protein [Alphaproteobacteria bacterium]MDB2532087.1 DUF952 domain-containing protein [Alphaproteobacteria bacterium]MDB2637978.1 DUF952 domain-containing protein [Alphaproteobacteria bacterium]